MSLARQGGPRLRGDQPGWPGGLDRRRAGDLLRAADLYAGWGLTDDRMACPRRTARRSLDELIAAIYLRYARYLRPRSMVHPARRSMWRGCWRRAAAATPRRRA